MSATPKEKPIKQPKEAKPTKPAKESRNNDGITPELPRTSFNFIASSWAAKRKRRYTNIAASVGIAVVMGTLTLGGVWAGAGNAALQSRASAASTTRTNIENEIKSITGGVFNIDGHEDIRQDEIADIYGKDVDTSFVLAQLLLHSPASIRITDMTITGPASVAAGAAVPVRPQDDNEETSETAAPLVTVPAGPTYTILVQAVSDDFKAAEDWRSMLAAPDSPFVASNPVIAGSAQELTLTLSAELLDADVLIELNRINAYIGWLETQAGEAVATEGEG